MKKHTEPSLVPTLERATHAIALWIEQALREVRLSQAEAHILAYLAQHTPCTINDLHHSFGHKRSTLTSLLDRIEGRGWIMRQQHHISRRLVQVELTVSGREIGEKVNAALQDLEQRVMTQLSTADTAAFQRVINVLQKEMAHDDVHR